MDALSLPRSRKKTRESSGATARKSQRGGMEVLPSKKNSREAQKITQNDST